MRVGGAALIGLALLGAYLLGASKTPSPQPQAEPVALVASQPPQPSEPTTQDRLGMAQPTALPAPSATLPQSPRETAAPSRPASVNPKAKPAEPPEIKRPKVDTKAVLTAAAIAALIVTASRNSYYATGRPCACPDDRMRNGRRCGSRSAYSRPGGAAPLCFPSDVTSEMIAEYRKRASLGK